MKRIYLDYAAATPIYSKTAAVMAKFAQNAWGNPSSIHAEGMLAAESIAKSRAQVAHFLSCRPDEIIFTASGSEANNLMLFGIARAQKKEGKHILISSIEHESTRACARALAERELFDIEIVPANKYGEIDAQEIQKRIRKSTILISVIAVNNEIGTASDISEIGKLILKINKKRAKYRHEPIYFHTDACQAAAMFQLNVNKLHVDALTLNSNKIYGPKGVGALFVRRGVKIQQLIYGGGQEHGMRSGTENAPGIAGFGMALEEAANLREKEFDRLNFLRGQCIKKLRAYFPAARINGSPVSYSPHILSFIVPGIDAEAAVVYLSEKGIDIASGSACAQKQAKLSSTLQAIGLTAAEIKSTLRISFGRTTALEDIKHFAATLKQIFPLVKI